MTLEQNHPNLKKLLVFFVVVFVILVGLAGLKVYLDVSKSPETPVMQDGGAPTGRLTEADIEQQLEALNVGDDPNKHPTAAEMEKQLETLNAGDDTAKRPTEAEIRQQLEALNQ